MGLDVAGAELVVVVEPAGVGSGRGDGHGLAGAAASAAAAVGARLVLVRPATAAAFGDAVASAAAAGECVVAPARPQSLGQRDDLAAALAGRRVVRLDLGPVPPDHSPVVRRHIRDRGLEGARYAAQAWAAHRLWPATSHPYGPHPDQHAGLRLPAGSAGSAPPGPLPVAVLVHGGYWRSRWAADLMDPLAIDLAGRGWAAWNVEYRRPDEHGWAATTADVAAGVAALATVTAAPLDPPLDLRRVVLLGHSAGGQLVVRLAADLAAEAAPAVWPALTVSLAGVLDLHAADRRRMGDGAVAAALGGRPRDLPQEYARSSPLTRLPIGSPLAVVIGRGDDPDLIDISRSFARAAAAAGDDVTVVEGPGDHFAVIDPDARIWASVVDVLAPHQR